MSEEPLDIVEVEGRVWPEHQPEIHRAGTVRPKELDSPLPGRETTHVGVVSGRDFNLAEIAIPIERQTLRGVEITREGIDRIRHHLGRLDPYAPNDRMIQRLERILAGELSFSEYDARFYSHELRELQRFEAAGWPDGRPEDSDELWHLWNNEHTATLEEFGFDELQQRLYHPDTEE